MSNDQIEAQIVDLDNLQEHREIVTFMRRSSPLNTSQRTALEQHRELILEYPVGDLRQHFEHPERPLTVEIGFGMGRSLVLMAKANPERNFVGIEVHVPGIAQCVYEAGMAEVKNLRVLDADAIQVLREMPDNSINTVQLYFPDPWQKKRHFKRRFVSHDRMPLVEEKLEIGGTFHAATDWEPYAEWMLDVLGKATVILVQNGAHKLSLNAVELNQVIKSMTLFSKKSTKSEFLRHQKSCNNRYSFFTSFTSSSSIRT
jgi:tRNA (guanine-N7-)-methyltransferase